MEFIDKVSDLILEDRNIKLNTLETYISNLKNLLKSSNAKITYKNLIELLNRPEEIIKLLKNKRPSTIRNYLASLVVLTESLDNDELSKKYIELMKKYQLENDKTIDNNQKTISQSKNWTTLKELRNILNNRRKELTRKNIFKKDNINKKEFDLLQKYVVGSLYLSDDENPPIRNDYASMTIINFKDYEKLSENLKNKNNYLVNKNIKNKFFSIADYKTSNKYGLKIIKVGKKLNVILNQWLKHNKGPNLLYDTRGNKLTNNGLSKLLMRVFESLNKNISSSIIRSIYISEKFPPRTQERNKISDLMLHSPQIASTVYAKD